MNVHVVIIPAVTVIPVTPLPDGVPLSHTALSNSNPTNVDRSSRMSYSLSGDSPVNVIMSVKFTVVSITSSKVPLVPLPIETDVVKSNVPSPPIVFLISLIDARALLVNVHVTGADAVIVIDTNGSS